jgi:hypothetical protein
MRTRMVWRRPVAVLLGGLMVASVVTGPTSATPRSRVAGVPSKPQKVASVPGRGAPVLPRPADPASAAALRAGSTPPAVWPAAGSAEVAVGEADRPGTTRAGGLPVVVAVPPAAAAAHGEERSVAPRPATDAPTRVRVEVLDHAAAARARVDGLLLRLRRADGKGGTAPVSLSVDYSGFRTAYGGDWAARLRLV